MNKPNRFILGLALLFTPMLASATAFINGGQITIQSTPVALSAGVSGKVQRASIRVIPGYSCKVYVGNGSMNRVTYDGVYAVLFPNSTGGWSEEWTVEDPGAADGIDVTQLYVWGDCPGEQVNFFIFQTGIVSAVFKPYSQGLVKSATAGVAVTVCRTICPAGGLSTFVSAWVVPGFAGKQYIDRNAGANVSSMVTLYPNSGNPNQSSARSEHWSVVDAQNRINVAQLFVRPAIGGEGLLVTVWSHS